MEELAEREDPVYEVEHGSDGGEMGGRRGGGGAVALFWFGGGLKRDKIRDRCAAAADVQVKDDVGQPGRGRYSSVKADVGKRGEESINSLVV